MVDWKLGDIAVWFDMNHEREVILFENEHLVFATKESNKFLNIIEEPKKDSIYYIKVL